MTKVLDYGHVILYDSMADDLQVVNSARVSFDQRSNYIVVDEYTGGDPFGTERPVKQMKESDKGLINYLLKNRHGTPFEHNAFIFDVKAPIFIFREWQRHRIGSFNEMSARYTELPGEWYIPLPRNVRRRVGRPGHYTYEQMDHQSAIDFINQLNDTCTESYRAYKFWLDEGIAPEQARLFLHVNHYSHMFWTVNARSLMNFLNLRNAPTAQWEIQQFAIEVEKVFAEKMPITYQAFLDNGRIAP